MAPTPSRPTGPGGQPTRAHPRGRVRGVFRRVGQTGLLWRTQTARDTAKETVRDKTTGQEWVLSGGAKRGSQKVSTPAAYLSESSLAIRMGLPCAFDGARSPRRRSTEYRKRVRRSPSRVSCKLMCGTNGSSRGTNSISGRKEGGGGFQCLKSREPGSPDTFN